MKQVSIFLITVVLIAGLVGCVSTPAQYNLTISSSAGGSVTTPGEGTFTYDEGAVVNLVAEAEEGYYFVKWTGDVGTMSDTNTVETTITMNGHYSITANFVPDGVEPLWDWYDLNSVSDDLSASYLLMNDLDSTTAGYDELASPTANEGKGWQPIGAYEPFAPFTGTFNGQGYGIYDLFIKRPDESVLALFGCTGEQGFIENVRLVNASVAGNLSVCTLVGANFGSLKDCFSTGIASGNGIVGGLVGGSDGIVTNCHSMVEVVSLGGFGGGLVGINIDSGNISDCYSSGSVSGRFDIGGLVGSNAGTVGDSYSICNVSGNNTAGGLVGTNVGNVDNCYAMGNVTGIYGMAGGLVGYNYKGTVSKSYSIGNVTGDINVGGLVGNNNGGTVSNSFWDTETSGQATSAGGTGKTTAEMQDITTLSGATWNIIAVANPSIRNSSYIWNIVDDVTYPFLSWEPVS